MVELLLSPTTQRRNVIGAPIVQANLKPISFTTHGTVRRYMAAKCGMSASSLLETNNIRSDGGAIQILRGPAPCGGMPFRYH